MLKQLTKRLSERTVITAAILSLMGCDAYAEGPRDNGRRTASPIKHVIVIMGENRTFDHVFATYVPRSGEHVDNLLSKGIINIDGTPGPNYAKAAQSSAVVNGTYSISPTAKTPYTSSTLQTPGTSYAPQACYTDVSVAAVDGPGCLATLALAAKADYGLRPQDLSLLTTGATGIAGGSPDTRILNSSNLPNGPYPLVQPHQGGANTSLYATYGGSPVHRFYQMWQELDCDVAKASNHNPSGCQADLFPFVEQTVSSGSNGNPTPHPLTEGNIAMGFYNVAQGDAPYLTKLAREYTLNDNYHQPVMGGTFANQMIFGYADVLYYADANGNPATPNHVQIPGTNFFVNEIENPNPAPGTNNWYINDGYGSGNISFGNDGGSYTNCSDTSQPGVAPIVNYLSAIHVSPNCQANAYYLLNNYVPAYIGSGATDPINNGPFTLPPVIKQRHIGDQLSQANVSWAYFGERWNDFKTAPGLGANGGTIDPIAYLYCNICNPFLYSASVMTNPTARTTHLKDTLDLYDAIAQGNLPAVSFVKPSTFNDGHPSSSRLDLFESFARRIIEQVQSNEELWESTAIVVTVDEGGGYYDSGYVQPVDYFGDGTRIPMIVVSKYSQGGRVSHEYSDHASVIKFIERNWDLPKLSTRSRDNLPNPQTSDDNPYVPQNRPALGDLFGNFNFADRDGNHDHDRGNH
jgi:phospholipase C